MDHDLKIQTAVSNEIYEFLLERFGDEGIPLDTMIRALATVMANLASRTQSDEAALASCAALFQTAHPPLNS